jgi:hypothetical protein
MRARLSHPATTTIAFKVPQRLARRLWDEAHREHRTPSAQTRFILERWFKENAAEARDGR